MTTNAKLSWFRRYYTATCDRCGSTVAKTKRLSRNDLYVYLTGLGWEIGYGDTHICRSCVRLVSRPVRQVSSLLQPPRQDTRSGTGSFPALADGSGWGWSGDSGGCGGSAGSDGGSSAGSCDAGGF